MGEVVKMSEFEANDGDEERILEWEMGLPNGDDLTPLSQSLIPPGLASAFSISPMPYRTSGDVNRASQNTLSSIRGSQSNSLSSNNNNNNHKWFTESRDPIVVEADETDNNGSGSDCRKSRKVVDCCTEEADSALRMDNWNEDPSARTLKRPRLVWTPQLHKRFVDVVAHLGIKNAVPKTIMQLMNVEGLTRENVASHLQKYRLYLKRMQGLSNDDPTSSDQLFASTPVPPQLQYEAAGNGNGNGNSGAQVNNHNNNSHNNNNNSSSNTNNGHMPVPMPMGMMPMPMYGMMNQGFHHGGFDPSMYNMSMNMKMNMNMNNMMQQQRDWSMNKHGMSFPHHHVSPSGDK